jgi:hypothetical protein
MLVQLDIPATEEWVYLPLRTSNPLPPHVLGNAEWYPIGADGHRTYQIAEELSDGRTQYQFCKFINNTWFIIEWSEEHLAFRTR